MTASHGYRIWGLDVRSSFELPGCAALSGASGERVELDLVDSDTLRRAWPGGDTLWEGQMGDGNTLLLERAADGHRLLTYAGEDRFLIAPGATSVACAPADPRALDWLRVVLDTLLSHLAVMRGAEALHASAVATDSGVVAILAPSGSGKTTLAATLLSRGATLLCDDLLVLRSDGDGVRAHAGPPVMSLPNAQLIGGRHPEWVESILGSAGEESWVVAPSAGAGPRRVDAICFLLRHTGPSSRVEPAPAQPTELFPHMMSLDLGVERERTRFVLTCDLLDQARCYWLMASVRDSPPRLADLAEEALALAGQPRDNGAPRS